MTNLDRRKSRLQSTLEDHGIEHIRDTQPCYEGDREEIADVYC